jgi:hypothetical protein
MRGGFPLPTWCGALVPELQRLGGSQLLGLGRHFGSGLGFGFRGPALARVQTHFSAVALHRNDAVRDADVCLWPARSCFHVHAELRSMHRHACIGCLDREAAARIELGHLDIDASARQK